MATLKELLRETTYGCVNISSAEMFCWKMGGKGKAEGSPEVTLGARWRSRLKVEGRSFGHWVDSNQYTMSANPRAGRVGEVKIQPGSGLGCAGQGVAAAVGKRQFKRDQGWAAGRCGGCG